MKYLFAPLLLLALAGPGAAAQRYVVGVEELDYYPLYALRDGRYVGTAREILDAFAADQGIELEYRPLPITRLTNELVNASIDFKFPDSPDWASDLRKGKSITYSKGVIAYVDGVMVRPESRDKGLASFHTLGTVAGFTPYAWLGLLKSGKVRLVENPQMRALQRQVLAGRVDGAYANVAVANHILETELQRPQALVFDASLPHARGEYLLSSARHAPLIARFDAWLTANARKVAAIKARYGAEKGVR